MQVVLVYRQPFHHRSLLKCAAVKNCRKFIKNPSFGGSQSFKVIDVNKSKNPVTSACYNKQHICTYLQSFSQ